MAEKRVSATTMNILYNTSTSAVNIFTTYKVNELVGEITGPVISSTSITPTTESTSITHKLTVGFKENTSTSQRTGYLSIKKGNKEVGLLTVNQQGEPTDKYFKWSNEQQDITKTVSSASTTLTETYSTTYSNITFDCDGTVCTAVTRNGNSISYAITQNNVESLRSGYIYAKYDGDTVGTLTVNQQGKNPGPEPTVKYFKWSDTSDTANTIPHDYNSGEIQAAYETDYLEGEYNFSPTTTSIMKYPELLYGEKKFKFDFDENLDAGPRDESINIVRTSDNKNIAKLTFIQKGRTEPGSDKYFYWNDASTTQGSEVIESTTKDVRIIYITNVSEEIVKGNNFFQITTVPTGVQKPTLTVNDRFLTLSDIPENTGTDDITYRIRVNYEGLTDCYYDIIQNPRPAEYFFWYSGGTNLGYDVSSNIEGSGGTLTLNYETNIDIEDITFEEEKEGYVTGVTTALTQDQLSVSFEVNDSRSPKVVKYNVKKDGNTIATWIIRQYGSYFTWYDGNWSIYNNLKYIEYNATGCDVTFKTNYSNYDFVISGLAANQYEINEPERKITIKNLSENTGDSMKVFSITPKINGKGVPIFTLNIVQQVSPSNYKFSWTYSSGAKTITYNIQCNETQGGAFFDTNICQDTSEFINAFSFTPSSDSTEKLNLVFAPGYVSLTGIKPNTSPDPKHYAINFNLGNLTGYICNIIQAGNGYFKWNNSEYSAKTSEVTSAAATLSESFDTNYIYDDISFECDRAVVSSVEKGENKSITYSVTENQTSSVRTGYVRAKYKDAEIGILIINQKVPNQ